MIQIIVILRWQETDYTSTLQPFPQCKSLHAREQPPVSVLHRPPASKQVPRADREETDVSVLQLQCW